MAEYLVELYVSRMDAGAVSHGAQRARDVAEEQSRHGIPVRCLSWIFIPEDETCLLLYEAPSADVVRDAATLAMLPFERIMAIASS